jgi:aminopeptidase N
MYGSLRDVMGDTAFGAFLRDYYARWALRHVDERAMRVAAERAHGRPLGWFFEQWVHRVGLVDYALRDVRWRRDGSGWSTRARLVKTGAYFHPMPVGVRTAAGWTVVRGEALSPEQVLTVRTPGEPLEVRLDPFGTTEDWAAPDYVFPRERRVIVPVRGSPLERLTPPPAAR